MHYHIIYSMVVFVLGENLVVSTNDILSGLNNFQIDAVKQYVEYHFTDDVDDCYPELKLDIYKKYTDILSALIAKYEVYCRDLPRDIVGIIEMIFRMLSSVALTDDTEKTKRAYDIILKCENYAINKLYLYLCQSHVKRIKSYIKTLRRFKHTGIKVNYGSVSVPVLLLAKKHLKEIKRDEKIGKKKLKCLTKRVDYTESIDTLCLQLSNIEQIIIIDKLENAFKLSEDTLKDIENRYPEIINNGYNDTKLNRIIYKSPEIISTILTIIAIIKWLKK